MRHIAGSIPTGGGDRCVFNKPLRGNPQVEPALEIVDLSHREGKSVNDGADSSHCLSHRIDDVVKQLFQLGPGAQIGKLDIKSAHRRVPVHPEDRFLPSIPKYSTT